MDFLQYRKNRAKINAEELRPYDGKMVAFSSDGCQVIASALDIVTLHRLVVEAGEDPEEVGYERIALGEVWQGAATELS